MSMKRTVCLLLSSCLITAPAGCSIFTQTETLSEKDPSPVFRGTPESEKDLLVNFWAYFEEVDSIETFHEMMEKSEAVIYGEVTDYVFVEKSVFFCTAENVNVIETIYGDIPAGSEVRIIKDGGYIPAKDYIRIHHVTGDYVDRFGKKLSSYSDEELSRKYFGYVSSTYRTPLIHERAIFFLRKTVIAEGFYGITGGPVFCEWPEGEDGMYFIPTLSGRTETGEPDESTFLTIEDLKEKIRNTVNSD